MKHWPFDPSETVGSRRTGAHAGDGHRREEKDFEKSVHCLLPVALIGKIPANTGDVRFYGAPPSSGRSSYSTAFLSVACIPFAAALKATGACKGSGNTP